VNYVPSPSDALDSHDIGSVTDYTFTVSAALVSAVLLVPLVGPREEGEDTMIPDLYYAGTIPTFTDDTVAELAHLTKYTNSSSKPPGV